MAATDVEIDSQPIKEVNSTSRGEDTGTPQVVAAAQSGGGPKNQGDHRQGKKSAVRGGKRATHGKKLKAER